MYLHKRVTTGFSRSAVSTVRVRPLPPPLPVPISPTCDARCLFWRAGLGGVGWGWQGLGGVGWGAIRY